MKPAPNPIDVVEQAYDLSGTNGEWLTSLAKNLAGLLEGGLGTYAYEYDMTVSPMQWFDRMEAVGVTASDIQCMRELMRSFMGNSMIGDAHVIPQPLERISDACKVVGIPDLRQDPLYRSFLDRLRARDMISLRTIEPGGQGVAFCAPQPADRLLDRRTKTLWARVAAHLASARRLRTQLTTNPTFEAVLTPNGKVEHAEGDSAHPTVRDRLRDAVQRQERARGRTRREDPEAATTMWTALVDGRWSLVDHFERGGRRYIVARRNEHGGPDPRALSLRERDVAQLAALGKSNKLIAYELGVSESTVATHLSTAMRKLRVKTRVELLRMLMQLAQQPPPAKK
jgi:DNA-binding CsgD family transcriptional regulator